MTTETHIIRKIAHYDAEAQNWTKPERWRDMARISAAEQRWLLEQHRAELAR
jgi:hypothetical protein